MKLQHLALPLGLLLTLLDGRAAHALDSFGGSCTSQGVWTRRALEQTHVIEDALRQLQSDPNCHGIESVLAKVHESAMQFQAPAGIAARPANRLETLPGEIGALRSYVANESGPLAEKATQALAARTLESATIPIQGFLGPIASQELLDRSSRAANYGLSLLDEAMTVLPQFQLCMNHHPNQAAAIFGASLQMAGAFASGGDGILGRIGNTVANFVKFMRNQDFARIQKSMTEAQYWNSMSCLLETSAQSYCEANEGLKLLNLQKKESVVAKQSGAGDSESPLDGYYLLVRELPIISDWLQAVQRGVPPKLSNEADFKSTTVKTNAELQVATFGLQGLFNEEVNTQYPTLNDLQSKKTFVKTLVNQISAGLINNQPPGQYSYDSGKSVAGSRNFFTTTGIPAEQIPYYLLGLDTIPPETISSDKEHPVALSPDQWMLNKGNWQSMFNDPDRLLETIWERLSILIERGQDNGSSYYQKRMSVDPQALVSDSLISQTVSVVDSLRHVRAYLHGLVRQIGRKPTPTGMDIAPTLINTIQRIDRILGAYDDLTRKSREIMEAYSMILDQDKCPAGPASTELAERIRILLKGIDPASAQELDKLKDEGLSQELTRSTNKLYQQLIETVYKEFNILLQREGFLNTRVSNYVRYDYTSQIRDHRNMDAYQRQILVTAGKHLLDHLIHVQRVNPAESRLDLNSAQMISQQNLVSVDGLLSDSLFQAINKLNQDYAGGPVDQGKTWLSWGREKYRNAPPRADDNGSFAQFRSKLCIQTLALSDWQRFRPLCAGSVLDSGFESNDSSIQLSMSYDKMASKKASSSEISPFVCAYRNYLRQNQVYWMTIENP